MRHMQLMQDATAVCHVKVAVAICELFSIPFTVGYATGAGFKRLNVIAAGCNVGYATGAGCNLGYATGAGCNVGYATGAGCNVGYATGARCNGPCVTGAESNRSYASYVACNDCMRMLQDALHVM